MLVADSRGMFSKEGFDPRLATEIRVINKASEAGSIYGGYIGF